MTWIDPPEHLRLIEPKRDCVIGLACARFPRRPLTCQHNCETIDVGDQFAIQWDAERVQSGLVSE